MMVEKSRSCCGYWNVKRQGWQGLEQQRQFKQQLASEGGGWDDGGWKFWFVVCTR